MKDFNIDELVKLLNDKMGISLHHPLIPRKPFDYEKVAYLISTYESAQYFMKNMNLAENLVRQQPLISFALSKCEIEGLNLEFGIAHGYTISRIANQIEGTIYGFDSFEGLPEDWTHFQKKGRFAREEKKPPANMPDNVEFIVGWFDDTLPGFLEKQKGVVRFLHIDCDLYSSTKTVLDNLADRIVPGTIIIFDEYLNYPGWQDHEYKAFQEFVQQYNVEYEYFGFASCHNSVAVRIKAIAN